VIVIVFQGSKNRLAKFIIPIIQQYIDDNNITYFYDVFTGGANVVDKVRCEHRIASDSNKDLIALLKYVQLDNDLSIAPDTCSFEHYADVRSNRNTGKYSQEYIALIGYCASYGGRYWSGGYGRDSKGGRSIYTERVSNLKQQAPNLKEIDFYCRDYKEYLDMNIRNALFYCDPPYNGTKHYDKQHIDYDEFYNFCRELSKDNIVIISEYNMPDDFTCIWQKERKVLQKSDRVKGDKVVEKLFIYKSL
jgi:site-specific DNA-adenine methylase